MTLERPMFPPRAESNLLVFPTGGRGAPNVRELQNPSFAAGGGAAGRYQRSDRPTMHTLVFRSRKLILEVDEVTLLADVRFDLGKAERKLAHHQAHLQSFTVQTQEKIRELAAVITKLGTAVAAARSNVSTEG